MQRYGLQRKHTIVMTRPDWVRGNRGRNRSTIDRSKRRDRYSRPRKDVEMGRRLRKVARCEGQACIREELQVRWLESELRRRTSQRRSWRWHKYMERRGVDPSYCDEPLVDPSLVYLHQIATEQEIDEAFAETGWLEDSDEWRSFGDIDFGAIRDEDDAEDERREREWNRCYNRNRRSDDMYSEYDDDDWDVYDDWKDYDSDPEPTSELWRDLWVAGRVWDPNGLDIDSSYCDEPLDRVFDEIEEYEASLERVCLEPTSHHPADERNMERHRAGERYFRQHGRTVQKGPLSVVSTACRKLVSFVDGELAPKRTDEFRQHLRECPRCSENLVEAVQLAAQLSQLRSP